MHRISVTTLEKYRRFIKGYTPFDTEQNLIDSLKGSFLGTNKSNIGGAYHNIIEGKYTQQGEMIVADGFIFTPKQAAPAIEYKKSLSGIIHEIDVCKDYQTHYGLIQVTGRIDGAHGNRLHDGKCTFRPRKPMEYLESCQWKIYCDMLDSPEFIYDLFEVKKWKDDQDTFRRPFIVPAEVEFIPQDPIHCLAYPDIKHEIPELLNGFLNYIDHANLWAYIKPARSIGFDEAVRLN